MEVRHENLYDRDVGRGGFVAGDGVCQTSVSGCRTYSGSGKRPHIVASGRLIDCVGRKQVLVVKSRNAGGVQYGQRLV